MRKLDVALKEHLEGDATSLCYCWILTRADGLVSGFTDHDDPLLIEEIVCQAVSGFQPTEAVSSLGLAPDNQDVEGALSSESISEEDLHAGKYDDARIDIWLVNWSQPDQRIHLRSAILAEMSQSDGVFKAELRGLTSLLDQNIGRSFSTRCDARLGDDRCGVNLDTPAFKTAGIISEGNWELGTRDTGAYATLHDVVRYFQWLGSQFTEAPEPRKQIEAAAKAIHAHEQSLTDAMLNGTGNLQGLADMKQVQIIGGVDNPLREGLVALSVDGIDAGIVVRQLSEQGIRVHIRKADHYSSNVLDPLGLASCVRVSMCHYNSTHEVAQFLAAMKTIISDNAA